MVSTALSIGFDSIQPIAAAALGTKITEMIQRTTRRAILKTPGSRSQTPQTDSACSTKK